MQESAKITLQKSVRILVAAAVPAKIYLHVVGNFRSAQNPLFCRSEISENPVLFENIRNITTFRAAWTSFPVEPENVTTVWGNGALYGPGLGCECAGQWSG